MLKPLRNNAGKVQTSRGMSIPAPVGGWDAASPVADMDEDRALVLDNWFPSTTDVRVRHGHKIQASGMGSAVVDSLMAYSGLTSATSALFAATGGVIYDVSASGVAVSSATGFSNNRWQHTNFTTSGGKFLWICNGTDAPQHYNGSVWAAPSLTGITATDVINVLGDKIATDPIERALQDRLSAEGVCILSIENTGGEDEIHVVIQSSRPIEPAKRQSPPNTTPSPTNATWPGA